jgi:hypothetical protein
MMNSNQMCQFWNIVMYLLNEVKKGEKKEIHEYLIKEQL